MYIHKTKGRKKEPTKEQFQIEHSIRRARERYGLYLTRRDLRMITMRIQQGEARLIEARSKRACVYELEWEGQRVRVAYDAKRKNPASFLPKPKTPST